MIPTVHLNGTSRAYLLAELEAAQDALRVAEEALRQVTVHGRDYYVQGPDAYRVARREMDARLDALRGVQRDLEALWSGIEAQGRKGGA
jgi:hypothetical protein